MDFSATHVRPSRAYRPEVHILTNDDVTFVGINFDRGLVSVSISIDQARDLASKLASALYDHDITTRDPDDSIEERRLDGYVEAFEVARDMLEGEPF